MAEVIDLTDDSPPTPRPRTPPRQEPIGVNVCVDVVDLEESDDEKPATLLSVLQHLDWNDIAEQRAAHAAFQALQSSSPGPTTQPAGHHRTLRYTGNGKKGVEKKKKGKGKSLQSPSEHSLPPRKKKRKTKSQGKDVGNTRGGSAAKQPPKNANGRDEEAIMRKRERNRRKNQRYKKKKAARRLAEKKAAYTKAASALRGAIKSDCIHELQRIPPSVSGKGDKRSVMEQSSNVQVKTQQQDSACESDNVGQLDGSSVDQAALNVHNPNSAKVDMQDAQNFSYDAAVSTSAKSDKAELGIWVSTEAGNDHRSSRAEAQHVGTQDAQSCSKDAAVSTSAKVDNLCNGKAEQHIPVSPKVVNDYRDSRTKDHVDTQDAQSCSKDAAVSTSANVDKICNGKTGQDIPVSPNVVNDHRGSRAKAHVDTQDAQNCAKDAAVSTSAKVDKICSDKAEHDIFVSPKVVNDHQGPKAKAHVDMQDANNCSYDAANSTSAEVDEICSDKTGQDIPVSSNVVNDHRGSRAKAHVDTQDAQNCAKDAAVSTSAKVDKICSDKAEHDILVSPKVVNDHQGPKAKAHVDMQDANNCSYDAANSTSAEVDEICSDKTGQDIPVSSNAVNDHRGSRAKAHVDTQDAQNCAKDAAVSTSAKVDKICSDKAEHDILVSPKVVNDHQGPKAKAHVDMQDANNCSYDAANSTSAEVDEICSDKTGQDIPVSSNAVNDHRGSRAKAHVDTQHAQNCAKDAAVSTSAKVDNICSDKAEHDILVSPKVVNDHRGSKAKAHVDMQDANNCSKDATVSASAKVDKVCDKEKLWCEIPGLRKEADDQCVGAASSPMNDFERSRMANNAKGKHDHPDPKDHVTLNEMRAHWDSQEGNILTDTPVAGTSDGKAQEACKQQDSSRNKTSVSAHASPEVIDVDDDESVVDSRQPQKRAATLKDFCSAASSKRHHNTVSADEDCARNRKRKEPSSPAKKSAQVERKSWQSTVIIIDSSDDEDESAPWYSMQSKPRKRVRAPPPSSSFKRYQKRSPLEQHLRNIGQYNFNFSEEEAQREQERLLREAAARVREEATRNRAGISQPASDVNELNQDHWKSPDMYVRLGLARGAPIQLVKRQYRRLALLYHPDKSKYVHTTARFQAVTEAYKHLCGESERLR